jgi:predicted PurR-regulated permease PerM
MLTRAEPDVPQWLARHAAIAWRLLAIVGAVYAAAWTIGTLRLVVVPVVIALFVTAILDRPVQALGRVGVPVAISSALGVVLLVMALAAAALGAALIIDGERVEIAESLGRGWQTLREWIAQREGVIAGVALDDVFSRARAALEARSGQVARWLAAGAAGIITAIAELVLAAFLAFFLLRDRESLTNGLLCRMPEDTAERLSDIGGRMWARVEGYLRGISLSAAAVTLLFGLALAIIGVPFVVPIMFIVFVTSFIPYAGPVVATILASLVALGDGGGMAALWVIVSGIVVQQIEGNLLEPFVVGRAVSLPPVVVLLAVTCGASLAGLIGTFVAVPTAAAIAVLFERPAKAQPAQSDS